jgi:hypothetical protein
MDIMELKLIFTLIIGLIAGFIGAISGAGGLISIPFLIFLGIPPQIVLATNKFGGLGLSLGGLYKFIKEKQIIWRYAIILSACGISGSLIGSKILLTVDVDFLQKLIGILLIVLAPALFLKKDFGIVERETSTTRKIVGGFLYFSIAILSSFFGGLGFVGMGIVVYFLGLTIIKANATELFSFSILSLTSVIIFAVNGIIDYKIGILLLLGMIVGGYLGAGMAIKKGNNWVKTFFFIVVIASAIKILISSLF